MGPTLFVSLYNMFKKVKEDAKLRFQTNDTSPPQAGVRIISHHIYYITNERWMKNAESLGFGIFGLGSFVRIHYDKGSV